MTTHPSSTPTPAPRTPTQTLRTDAQVIWIDYRNRNNRETLTDGAYVPADFARQLERDLNAVQQWHLEAVHEADKLKAQLAAKSPSVPAVAGGERIAELERENAWLRAMFRSAAIDRDSYHAMCTRIWNALGEVNPDKVHETPCDVQLVAQRDEARAKLAAMSTRPPQEGSK